MPTIDPPSPAQPASGSTALGRYIEKFIYLLVLLVLAAAFDSGIWTGSGYKRGDAEWTPQSEHDLETFCENFRQHLAARSGGGNVFLYIPHAKEARSSDDSPLLIYLWANYAMYPHRAWVGEPSAVINSSEDIRGANFDPDPLWLARHNARAVVRYDPTPPANSAPVASP